MVVNVMTNPARPPTISITISVLLMDALFPLAVSFVVFTLWVGIFVLVASFGLVLLSGLHVDRLGFALIVGKTMEVVITVYHVWYDVLCANAVLVLFSCGNNVGGNNCGLSDDGGKMVVAGRMQSLRTLIPRSEEKSQFIFAFSRTSIIERFGNAALRIVEF